MDKLDKLKMASSSIGERLMIGGAQMSRMLSTKMKEVLQAPTPESKIVDEGTLETMEEPNWGLNLRICAMINSEALSGTEIVKAIKRKIGSSKGAVGQRLSLDLLETCTSNCDKVFSEVASEKVLDEMLRMIQDARTDPRNRAKAMQLIRAWGESEELMYLPAFRQTHLSLKRSGIPAGPQGENFSPTHPALEPFVYQQPMPPPERYPLPDMDLIGTDNDTSQYAYTDHSAEQKKELLVVGRNSLDLLSSILESGVDPIPIHDELTVSMLDKCKRSLPAVQRIAETTTDDDILLFEALNLHDELQQIISRCDEIKGAIDGLPDASTGKPAETVPAVTDVESTEAGSSSEGEVKVKVKEEVGVNDGVV